MTALANDATALSTVLYTNVALDVGSYPAPYTLDSEAILVTGGDNSTALSVVRARNGTAAAAHSAGTTLVSGWSASTVTPAAFVEPTTATPEAIANALIAAGLMEAS